MTTEIVEVNGQVFARHAPPILAAEEIELSLIQQTLGTVGGLEPGEFAPHSINWEPVTERGVKITSRLATNQEMEDAAQIERNKTRRRRKTRQEQQAKNARDNIRLEKLYSWAEAEVAQAFAAAAEKCDRGVHDWSQWSVDTKFRLEHGYAPSERLGYARKCRYCSEYEYK